MIILVILVIYGFLWSLANVYNVYPLFNYHVISRKIKKTRRKHELPKHLPKISILLPAYHEEGILPYSIERIFETNYPKRLIEVLILMEKDDFETVKVAEILSKKYEIRHLKVKAYGLPRGKPRALNFGLKYVTGNIVGVIDAEDVIDRNLFNKVTSLISSGYDVVQGILDMTNDKDGFMNMHMRAEYRYWYKFYMPSLMLSSFPVPLGGSTNFFKREVLREMKGWDPFNVTEDFDIGLRMYNKQDYKISMIKSTTREESPTTFVSWLKQRTRWQRGKIHTLRKILKNPPSEIEKKFHSFMISMLPHMGVINLTGFAFSVFAVISRVILPLWLYPLFIFNGAMLIFYIVMHGYNYFKALRKSRKRRLIKSVLIALTLPIYWFAQWISDFRAIKQEYFGSTIFWEKNVSSWRPHKK